MGLPRVELLLATYNGARYLAEQLESLIAQDYQDFHVIISDDGSSDATPAIIADFISRYPGLFTLLEPAAVRLGASRTFARLLDRATADYVIFCDQDDVWLPEKIARTLDLMEQVERRAGQDQPVLVHTDLIVVDEIFRTQCQSFMAYSGVDPNRNEFPALLLGNVVTGCTAMANRSLYELARPIPAEALMFDHWLAQVAAGLGTIAYLDAPTVLYRQHATNVLGARPKGTRSFVERIKQTIFGDTVLRTLSRYTQHAAELARRYRARLDPEDLRSAMTLAEIWQRPRLIRVYKLMTCGLFKATIVANIGLLVLLLRDGRPARFGFGD